MKQLIKTSRRPATGTLQAGQQTERTLWEKLMRRAGRIEEKKEPENFAKIQNELLTREGRKIHQDWIEAGNKRSLALGV